MLPILKHLEELKNNELYEIKLEENELQYFIYIYLFF